MKLPLQKMYENLSETQKDAARLSRIRDAKAGQYEKIMTAVIKAHGVLISGFSRDAAERCLWEAINAAKAAVANAEKVESDEG